jgi:L-methionine (R)-S-oxide reductase
MTYREIEYSSGTEPFYSLLREQLIQYTAEALNPISALANAAAVLGAAISDVNWVGFYFVSGERLVLGPFQGRPAVMEIGCGQGVCGTAWLERKAQVVKDVRCFAGHIVCDCSSVSELVVPVFDADHLVLGVIDIDSPMPGRFDETDAEAMGALAEIIAPYLAELSECLLYHK